MSRIAPQLTVVAVALAALISPGSARACDPAIPTLHAVDSTMVGVDQTPPTLPQPTVAEIQHYDSDQGCFNQKCGWDNGVSITNLETGSI